MSDEIAIKVDNVSKRFLLPHERASSVKGLFTSLFRSRSPGSETQKALNDISFEIKQGEFFGIVGRNGSGKSTMLKILAGIYQPSSGTVTTRGKLVPFIELGVGFNPELTGRENVYLNGAMLGFSEQEIDDLYDDIVSFAELGRFMDQKLKNYSSGMQVRLAFSMATRSEAEILLIDEVLAVGDADFQRKCFGYFRELKKRRKTVVFVSHDMSAVREYCNKAILIEKSEIVYAGSANDTAKEYTRLFLPDVYAEDRRQEKLKQHDDQKQKNKGKWGSGGIDIVDLKTDKRSYTQEDKNIEITFTTEAAQSFHGEIIPGVTIKNESGEPVCGTNSKIIQPDKRYVIDDGTRRIKTSWTIPNIFNDGSFVIEPAVLSAGSADTLQWWDEALRFRVTNEESTPYPAAPKITMRAG